MAPVINGKVIFNEVPIGYPEPGKTLIYQEETIDPDTITLAPGEWLVKVLVLSVDPYLRERMAAPAETYFDAFHLGAPIENFGVSLVLRSENPAFKPGDHVYGIMDFAHYVVCRDSDVAKSHIIDSTHKLSWSTYVGAAGMPGKTAYYGWKEYARSKEGEVAFVSTGAGAVGSLVVQLAKRDGMKVIASAGSDDKVKYLREIGADVAFNYKTTDTLKVLKKEGPVDVSWDNVGGPTLEAALETAANRGRIIVCGMISGYNGETPHVFKDLTMIMSKTLSINGFLVTDLEAKYIDEFRATMPKLLASDEISFREDVTRGLENSGEAILSVQKGTNIGKKVIIVADE